MEKIDYELVLADMEAKRAALDTAIAGLRQWLQLGGGPEGAMVANISAASTATPTEVRPDSFFGLSIPDAAIKYLRIVRQSQSTGQICDALRKGGLHSDSKNFVTTVHSILTRRERAGGEIVKVKRGQWGLVDWNPTMRRRKAVNDRVVEEHSEPEKTKGRPMTLKETAPAAMPGANLRDRLKQVLREAGKPLTVSEITDALRATGYAFNPKSVKTTLSFLVNRGLSRQGVGQYGLSEWQSGKTEAA